MSQKAEMEVGKGRLERFKQWILPPNDPNAPVREDIRFMPTRLGAFFLNPPKASFLIIRYTLILFVIAIIWACFSPIDEITRAEGKIIPSSNVQVIQNLEGGIVSDIPVKIGQVVHKDDIVMKLDETRFASSAEESKAGIDVLKEQVNQRAQEIAEKRSRLSQLQQSYAFINKELQMSKPLLAQGVVSEVEILRLQRQVSDLRGEMDANRLAIPRLESQLAEAKAKLEGASASSLAAKDRLDRTTVRSPVDGIIKTININTVGGVIQPGMNVMEIVPVEDKLLVEARVRPSDVGFLKVGQPAMVKISAYDFSIYGGLEAEVENITADSITNEKGESFYLVRVRTKKNYLGTEEKPLPIIPGMMASASIKTGSKSLMTYLLKPIFKAKSDALTER
ncbi:HlyD family type I secretion periplasmic adaptor subunit [Oxalobacter formigenes]|uniref:Membrane fusion protein (MFP) family protein n=1 Tax=Oxalobacter formigenes OXCC13 TaxID=556269 RepID=C3X7D8_OXAFO|nr:HlyD family type I secretion periplasmic adaptor subunit [Oxalobacter formigenes]ARQ46875.1 Leukotoxin export protein LtxD [Oxalobacter formigenes]ARQ78924.1 HlyD family type I secretion periplasmic adaptor subunit [Oxalobacter formigenes OXCC13]EEO29114.1 type I secretion membrane fusion protein, HlyD family [Oxalobacter formigenes OXCC13]MCZ4063313.1 HlyD family type I secretion periplasmic adaptor subunit [Oxalobacter formigenes]QDX32489.1 HlyD family type I secretion periplasmic adaptor